MEFIKNPSKLLRKKVPSGDRAAFDMGRAAMALEVMTQIRVLETQTIYSTVEVQPIIAALHTLLTDCGFDEEELWRIYDRLSSSRRMTFVPEHVPVASVDADDDVPHDPPLWTFSEPAFPGGVPLQQRSDGASSPPRLLSDPSSVGPTEPSEEALRAAYERGKDLGLLDPGKSGIRSPRRFGRVRSARSQ